MDEVDDAIDSQNLSSALCITEVQHSSAYPAWRSLEELRRTKPVHEPRPINTARDGAAREIPEQCRGRGAPSTRIADGHGLPHHLKATFEFGLIVIGFQVSEQGGADARPQLAPPGILLFLLIVCGRPRPLRRRQVRQQ